uniref:Putative homing endonuclease n=2 Tax=viral metagenome TaxID=1070528 RepID=A0A6H1ZI21_9ZZZZ
MFTEKSRERFWSKVDKRGMLECWNWTGCTNTRGYGTSRINGYQYQAHRLSWMLTKGDIPDDFMVLHVCGNARCVNNAHLYLGYAKHNAEDLARHNVYRSLGLM